MGDNKKFTCPRCGLSSNLKANICMHLKSKKPCETKYSIISRQEVLESLQRERKLPTTECEFCKKVYCKKRIKQHVLVCTNKPPNVETFSTLEERVNYLEEQLANMHRSMTNEAIASDKNNRYKKNKLNKQMRARCWMKYVGEDDARTMCVCCQEQMITTFSFECAHVVARACGGSNDLSNLRPICRDCNCGMGIRNMREYAKEMFGVDVV